MAFGCFARAVFSCICGVLMSDLLDQGAIDALLAQAETTPDTSGPRGPELIFSRKHRDPETTEIRVYDFKRPERVSKDQMRALQTLHEGFARNFGASLSGFLRTIVEVKVATCEQMTYSEFTSGLPNPTSFNLVGAEGLEGQMCLEVSPLIIYPIIDRLLGGSSQELFIPQRPMTQIETRLINNVTGRGLSALSEAWVTMKQLQFRINSTESNPQLVQILVHQRINVIRFRQLRPLVLDLVRNDNHLRRCAVNIKPGQRKSRPPITRLNHAILINGCHRIIVRHVQR
jgi:flagellar motor switch protein FliM